MIVGSKLRNKLKLPGLRIAVDKKACVGCDQCTKHCPMSLNVREMVQNGDMTNTSCILCGKCIDQCSKHVLQYTLISNKQEVKSKK